MPALPIRADDAATSSHLQHSMSYELAMQECSSGPHKVPLISLMMETRCIGCAGLKRHYRSARQRSTCQKHCGKHDSKQTVSQKASAAAASSSKGDAGAFPLVEPDTI